MHDWVICLRSFHLDGMDFLQWNETSIQKSVNYNSVNLLLSLKTPDGSPTVLLPLKSLRIYIGG